MPELPSASGVGRADTYQAHRPGQMQSAKFQYSLPGHEPAHKYGCSRPPEYSDEAGDGKVASLAMPAEKAGNSSRMILHRRKDVPAHPVQRQSCSASPVPLGLQCIPICTIFAKIFPIHLRQMIYILFSYANGIPRYRNVDNTFW